MHAHAQIYPALAPRGVCVYARETYNLDSSTCVDLFISCMNTLSVLLKLYNLNTEERLVSKLR